MEVQRRAIQYLLLSNLSEPFLLARVRWPDVFQAISPVRPDWQDDPGLFDLPYSPASTSITRAEAAQLATQWGAELPSEDVVQAPGPSLIRRMPSDWTNLSTAERRAWSIELDKAPRLAAGVLDSASSPNVSAELAIAAPPVAPAPPTPAVPPVPPTSTTPSRRRGQPDAEALETIHALADSA